MSDYIAELRRELVGAAERERRRSAPRRALTRWGGPLVTGVATAAMLLAAVLGVAVLGREEPQPIAAPRIVATIPIGGQPLDAGAGAGAVWVADATGRVLRIDPGTRRVAATTPAADEATVISASDAGVWVGTWDGVAGGNVDGDGYQLLRIDPRSNRVVSRTRLGNTFVSSLEAASPGVVWAQLQRPRPLKRLDPSTNRLDGGFSRRHYSALASRSGVLWALASGGVLERRDAVTGRLLSQLGGFARSPSVGGDWFNSIAADDDGAWVATGRDGRVAHVTSDGEILTALSVGANGPIAVAGRWLWVTVGDVTLRNGQLVRVDRVTGEVTGRLRLGSRTPEALVVVGDDVWAVVGDGTVLVVR